MNDAPRIRVLVADDHPVVRDGLRRMMEATPDLAVVAEAGDGRAAVRAFREHAPDIVLMDLRMPVLEGLDAIAAILRFAPEARILVLTTFDGDADIERSLAAGARGYLLKDATHAQILDAVRAVHAGRRHVAPAAAVKLAERPPGPGLSPRELEVLELVAQGKGNRDIAVALGIGEATVKTHVLNILDKLEANDRTDAAMIALRRGLIRLP